MVCCELTKRENKENFLTAITASYTFKGNSIILGASVLDGVPNEYNLVKVPLQTFNRHGLIAGATGTGKTKTLQMIVEKLSFRAYARNGYQGQFKRNFSTGSYKSKN